MRKIVDGVEVDLTSEEISSRQSEQAAWEAEADERAARSNREKRDRLIAATDFYALTDVTMDAAMTTYRQQLRDITSHDNWPNLSDDDWPVAP